MPTVSVVIPSYNHARFLDETLGSVLGQSFGDLEVLVVDDASTDGSQAVLAAWAARDARVRLQCHDTNLGIPRSLNDGLAAAAGEFMAFLDSDDWWHPRKLERQLAVARERPDVAVWTDGVTVGADGREEGSFVKFFSDERMPPSGWLFEAMIRGNLVTLQTVLVRRAHMHDIVFDERVALLNDYTFLIDLSRRCEFAFVPETLARFRLHGANTTFARRELWATDARIVRDDVLARHGDVMSPADRQHFQRVIASFEAFALWPVQVEGAS
jgi:glycosyltransferase involved in cell wall biosynthesis